MRPLAFDAPSEWEFSAIWRRSTARRMAKPPSAHGACTFCEMRISEEKGLGFALAGNSYPDFLLWLVDDATGKQWLTSQGPAKPSICHTPKLGLYKEVKTWRPR